MVVLPLDSEAAQVLLRMVDRGEKVSALTNAELAQILVDLTDNTKIDDYYYLVLMECAYRLAPEVFK